MLNQQDLNEFKEIWLAEFGEEIGDDVAEEQGQRLLNLFQVIYKAMPKKENEDK
ncbi:MAG: hypothetical protein WC720_01215 [Candidatus Shapirobacteria bacterium]|jgi:hypothetical protein